MKTTGKRYGIPMLLVALLLLSSCATENGKRASGSVTATLDRAQAMYDEGRYTDAMIECVDLNRRNSLEPGLVELQQKIMVKLAEKRSAAATMRASNTSRLMVIDVEEHKNVPATYGLRRTIKGESGTLRSSQTSMELALQKKVTVHLDGVNMDAFALAIGQSEGINMITDQLDSSKTMTVHAENVPLQEILDFVSRNLGVAFFVGENIIWATPKESTQPQTPLMTRMYRLRKGMSNDELLADSNKINIIDAIERFVPKETGTDMMFDKKAHVLIVRNTRENLARIEDIIETLDVCPPQVLIEARFITTSVNDLRELGIDWILDSSIAVSKKDGANKTQINAASPPNNIVNVASFSPTTAAQGLNFTYQGLLTDPMFKAVLHALETSGKSRTLSVPKVTTVNNQEAHMHVGDTLMYIPGYDTDQEPIQYLLSNGNVVQYNVSRWIAREPVEKKLGYDLRVTPSVGSDMRSISLKIAPTIQELTGWFEFELEKGSSPTNAPTGATALANPSTAPPLRLPKIQERIIETEVVVQSGETVAMGGLITSNETKNQTRVPILGSIPLIGRLFRSDSIDDKKENLLIFVTATILSEMGENLIAIDDELPVAR